MALAVRDATPADIEALANLVFASFRQVADEHHAYTFTGSSLERSRAIVSEAVAAGHVVALIAESSAGSAAEGFAALIALSGSAFMLDTVAVAVGSQSKGSGRIIVEAALQRAIAETGSNGHSADACEVRLMVDSYNMRALALYSRCGFVVTGTVAVMELPASHGVEQEEKPSYSVRAMTAEDMEECKALAWQVASLDSSGELAGHLSEGKVVLSESGQIVGYCSRVMMTGHLVCASKEAAMAVLGWVGRQPAVPGETRQLIVPLQQYPDLAQWMLGSGWRATKTLLQMSHGPCGHTDQNGVYFPMC